jgi:hypothetical protein
VRRILGGLDAAGSRLEMTYLKLDSDEAPINALCRDKCRPGTTKGIEDKAIGLAKGGDQGF